MVRMFSTRVHRKIIKQEYRFYFRAEYTFDDKSGIGDDCVFVSSAFRTLDEAYNALDLWTLYVLENGEIYYV
jgi:hypothetical protein